ncbi:MAG: rhodanese-related sulfurtransferase, partial [Nonlabens sp.]
WVGSLIENIDQKIILITPEGREKETVTRLARVGYDNAQGYLIGGFSAWKTSGFEISSIENVTAQGFIDGLEDGSIKNPIDTRRPGEYESGHICSVPLHTLSLVLEEVKHLNSEKIYHIHCAGGYRSVIFSSIAKANGIKYAVNVEGGFGAIKKTNLKNQKIVATSNCSL